MSLSLQGLPNVAGVELYDDVGAVDEYNWTIDNVGNGDFTPSTDEQTVLKITAASSGPVSGPVTILNADGSVVRTVGNVTVPAGSSRTLRFAAPSTPGTGWNKYEVHIDGTFAKRFGVDSKEASDPTDRRGANYSEPDDIDPANHRWIVNADNSEGAAPAPVLRRQGVEIGPNGATFRFPNGKTVDVGAIEDADEVARHLEGADAGDVIEADQDAASGDGSASSSSSGGLAAGAAAATLGVAYLIHRRK